MPLLSLGVNYVLRNFEAIKDNVNTKLLLRKELDVVIDSKLETGSVLQRAATDRLWANHFPKAVFIFSK